MYDRGLRQEVWMIHHDALGHTGPPGTTFRAPSRRWLSPGVRLPHRSTARKERNMKTYTFAPPGTNFCARP